MKSYKEFNYICIFDLNALPGNMADWCTKNIGLNHVDWMWQINGESMLEIRVTNKSHALWFWIVYGK